MTGMNTLRSAALITASVILSLGLSTTGARAQMAAYAQHSASQGQYGGGFIELLMTGRNPPPRVATRGYHASRQAAAPVAYAPDALPIEPDIRPLPRQPRREASLAPEGRVQMGLDPRFERQLVEYDGRHAPGTVIVNTETRFLYLVQGSGKALRYGIGVGRPGFEWAGRKSITMKREWPDWRPPAQMLMRRPDLPRFMPGGEDNPLGARALYLGSSLYRIHGTNEPHTIGQAVSSGCIRMRNEDVIDLYNRVRVGTSVVVI
jgi:lipoprotein-anchoring transpeptidase ErfK/SrfK